MVTPSFLHAAAMQLLVPERMRLVRRVRSREHWTAAQIRDHQDARVRELVAYCWQHVPYYRRTWSGAISGPQDIRGVADLARLPRLTKDELRANLDALTTTAPNIRSSPARSGGSTGRPTVFRMTHHDEQLAWAQMYTAWQWAGWRVGEPFLAVGGESIGVGVGDRRTWKDRIVNRWTTSGSNLTLERTKHLAASPHFARIRLIYGYPSAIFELCDLLRTIGARPRLLRAVVCTAEVLRPDVRKGIADALGVPVHDQWGMNDGGLFAAEGPDRDGLHVFFERGVMEVLDEADRPVDAIGQPGRAVATCLTNLATPFVRYETGDDVHWHSRDAAPSGITWPRIGPVDGRTGDVIHAPGDRRIAMPGLTLVMRWIDGLRQYQFIQTAPDAVTVRLDRASDFAWSEAQVIDYLRQKISDRLHWTIVFDRPELTANGKVLIIRNDWLRSLGRTRP
jgi:phenylacetate-CoA ligase